jgi:proline-specific peptidase
VLSTEGKIPFTVGDDTFYTWYKIVGDLASATQRPVVALHGGPGMVHNYLLPISDLADRGYPVIFYDQIGNGQSSHAADKPDQFWTIDLMIDELVNVLRHFNIENGFDLVGHNWGGILASEFVLRRQPSGLKHLILTNSPANLDTYAQSVRQLAATFPEWVREGMKNPHGDPKYRAAYVEFFSKHACRADPSPPEFWYSCYQSLDNPRVHDALLYVLSATFVNPLLMTYYLIAGVRVASCSTGPSRTAFTRSMCQRWSSTASTTLSRTLWSSLSSNTFRASSGCASRTAAIRRSGKNANGTQSFWVTFWNISTRTTCNALSMCLRNVLYIYLAESVQTPIHA